VPKRARSWKRRIQPRVGLKIVDPALYSTPVMSLFRLTGKVSMEHYSRRLPLDKESSSVLRLPSNDRLFLAA